MKFILLLFCVLSPVLCLSCKDNPTSPYLPGAFTLAIRVKDSFGKPVPHLRIGGGSLLSPSASSTSRLWTNGAFYARLIAENDTTHAVIFKDSVLMVQADLDFYNPTSVLGYSSADGKLFMGSAMRFPGVLSLPPVVRTTGDPTPLGTFSILDSTVFFLQDTLAGKFQVEVRTLRLGDNAVDITWKPTAESAGPPAPPTSGHVRPPTPPSPLAATLIYFRAGSNAQIHLSVLNLDGSVVKTLWEEVISPGTYSATWSTLSNVTPQSHDNVFPTTGTVAAWKLEQNFPNPFD